MKRCLENADRMICPDYPEKCRFCGAFREPTNADSIRAMSDEELAELHYSSSAHCIADDPTVCDRHDFIGNLTPCEQCYLKWLQQPAEDDDHDERKENENV